MLHAEDDMNIIKIKLSVTNCYLIKSDENYVLIDTGYAEDWELFRKNIETAGIHLSQISHLILTHHHDDHCGFLHAILNENASIRVVMSGLCAELIQKGENDLTHGGGLLNKRIAFLMRYKQLYVSLQVGKKIGEEKNLMFAPYYARACDIILREDTALRDIGIPLNGRIIFTPGHTADSFSVIFDDGRCFVGDAAANMLNFAGTKNCVIFICDMDEYYRSWNRLIVEGALQIYPGHGNVFDVEKLKANLGKNKQENLVLN